MIEFIPEDGKNSFVSIIQQFEGELYFMIIVYDQGNIDETTSPDILASMSKNLIELINTNKITRAISEAFTTIKNYSKLDEEENLIEPLANNEIVKDLVVDRTEFNDRL